MLPPKITSLNIGPVRADLSKWYTLPPGHPDAGRVDEVATLNYHIALPGRSVLVDATAYEFSPEMSDLVVPGFSGPSLLEQLDAAGIEAAGISDVIITHAHFDHYNALTHQVEGRDLLAFPNARHYLSAHDWQPETFTELEERTLALVQQQGLLTQVEGVFDLGDGLTILPAPGETPGHQILLVQKGEFEAYFIGDLYHHYLERGVRSVFHR
jgi:glyoxylase-like metal-dependent hydrolase (beta-lactamase superfamily II)